MSTVKNVEDYLVKSIHKQFLNMVKMVLGFIFSDLGGISQKVLPTNLVGHTSNENSKDKNKYALLHILSPSFCQIIGNL